MAKREKTEMLVEEIRELLREYDVAGAVVVIDRERTSYAVEISPSWSGIAMEGQGAVRLKLKKDEVDRASWTGHIVYSIRDICSQWAQGFSQLAKLLESHAKVEHKPFYTN